MSTMTKRKRRIRTGVRVSVALCAAAASAGIGHGLANMHQPAPEPTLICGEYTQANADMTGCELLPGYTAVPVDAPESGDGLTFYEDGSYAIGDGPGALTGCAPTAMCNA